MRNLNPPVESCIMSLKPRSGSAFLQEKQKQKQKQTKKKQKKPKNMYVLALEPGWLLNQYPSISPLLSTHFTYVCRNRSYRLPLANFSHSLSPVTQR